MDILAEIYTRRSVRNYTDREVSADAVAEIVKAGSWAPSGLNNQPWRFVIIRSAEKRRELAALTAYGRIIENAPVCIAVFCDRSAMYHDVKDHQGMGACLQNMLLAAHALGLGAVWLGEILRNAEAVRGLLEVPDGLELMAVIAVGHPAQPGGKGKRRPVAELIVREW